MTEEQQDDFTPLIRPDHWLEWLGEDPSAAIRRQIERLLQNQVPGSFLKWVRLQGAPFFLTGGRKNPDGVHMQVVRTGLAAPFKLMVRAPDGDEHRLEGVFSWVAVGLDGDRRRDRTFLDIDADPKQADKDLEQRIQEVALEHETSNQT